MGWEMLLGGDKKNLFEFYENWTWGCSFLLHFCSAPFILIKPQVMTIIVITLLWSSNTSLCCVDWMLITVNDPRCFRNVGRAQLWSQAPPWSGYIRQTATLISWHRINSPTPSRTMMGASLVDPHMVVPIDTHLDMQTSVQTQRRTQRWGTRIFGLDGSAQPKLMYAFTASSECITLQ